MGLLKQQPSRRHRSIIAFILLSCSLSSCAAVTAVSAIPGALYGAVADQFLSKEVSVPHSMRACLVAIQHSLQSMRLDIDILEVQENGGYGISFNNHKLNGDITLLKQTESLTTIKIRVKTMTRQESIEQAIIKMVETTLKNQDKAATFQLAAYHDLRAEPTIKSKHLGWFRPGAMLEASKSKVDGWLTVELPSGDSAFIQGGITRNKTGEKIRSNT